MKKKIPRQKPKCLIAIYWHNIQNISWNLGAHRSIWKKSRYNNEQITKKKKTFDKAESGGARDENKCHKILFYNNSGKLTVPSLPCFNVQSHGTDIPEYSNLAVAPKRFTVFPWLGWRKSARAVFLYLIMKKCPCRVILYLIWVFRNVGLAYRYWRHLWKPKKWPSYFHNTEKKFKFVPFLPDFT